MTVLEEKDEEDYLSFENDEIESFDLWKKNVELWEDEELQWDLEFNEENTTISEDQEYDDLTDWYEEELKIIELEKSALNAWEKIVDQEQLNAIKVLTSNIWTTFEQHKKTDTKKILMWLTIKWMMNIQAILDERNTYHSLLSILQSKNMNKRALEVLFYSNALKDILWDDYLEHYLFDDIYLVFKNISKNEDFLKLVKKAKINKEHIQLIKKNYIKSFKFAKEKKWTKKKNEQVSLFWLDDLNLWQSEKSTSELLQTFLVDYKKDIFSSENKKFLWFIQWIKINKEENYSNILLIMMKSFFVMKDTMFIKELLKQSSQWKILKERISLEMTQEEFDAKEQELYTQLVEEFKWILKKVTYSIQKKNLWNKEYNTNLKKYIWVTWFIDDEVYQRIKEKYHASMSHVKISRNWIMSRYVSWNEKFKKELFNELYEWNNEQLYKLKQLYLKVDVLNKINELKLTTKNYLRTLSFEQCFETLKYWLKKKKQNEIKEDDIISSIFFKCWYFNIENSPYTIKLKKILDVIEKNLDKTEEEKENIFVDTLEFEQNWKVKQLSLKFKNQVKKLMIEIFWLIILEYCKSFAKSEEFNEKYSATLLWFIRWVNLKKKWRSVSYITEKWTYWIALMWVFSSLFSKLEWVWMMNVNINWNWIEILNWIKFLSLDESFLDTPYFQNTIIQKEELNNFKNFKAKLIKYLNILLSQDQNKDLEMFDNMIFKIDRNNNYMFMKIVSRREYWKIDKMFISDWETSIILTKEECEVIFRDKSSFFQEKDFISTIRVREKQKWYVEVKWLDDDWEFKTNEIITNLSFDKDLDKFELQINKWFLWYYLLYFKQYFDESDYLKYNKWMIIFDLETIWFTWNILLSYFLEIWKYKWKDCVILRRHSNPEYWNFFDQFCWVLKIDNLTQYIESKIRWDYILSWHNTLWFDNKRLASDMYANTDMNRVYITKTRIDKYSLDTLKILEEQWYWKMGLDSLSKANFDFWKNISKSWWWLMSVINDVVKVIKDWDESILKANWKKIKNFVLYNKNDVLMSTWLLWQMLKYWMVVTEKWVCRVNVQEKIKSIRWF